MRQKYPDLIVNKDDSILSVLKKMDKSKRKLLVVLSGDKFESVISIGDIQRAIISGIDLNSPVQLILRTEVTVAKISDNMDQVKERMRLRRNELMPILSLNGELVNIIFWDELFEDNRSEKNRNKFTLPVIIMAGGFGTRLKPLTNILPKPLIPINEKTIIEDIMDRFVECGSDHFHISVNYKAEMIKYYFDSLNNPNYKINFFEEKKPLGTAGSLHLLKNQIKDTFFVSNCDILIDQDYGEILNYHRENNNEITAVAAIKNYSIPYGIFTTKADGLLDSLIEKPELVFKINTGLYILEPGLIEEIPKNEFFHITSLIEKLLEQKRRVGIFPVSEGSWTDVGNWAEYYKMVNTNVQHFK